MEKEQLWVPRVVHVGGWVCFQEVLCAHLSACPAQSWLPVPAQEQAPPGGAASTGHCPDPWWSHSHPSQTLPSLLSQSSAIRL